jgi:hypothetical protein
MTLVKEHPFWEGLSPLVLIGKGITELIAVPITSQPQWLSYDMLANAPRYKFLPMRSQLSVLLVKINGLSFCSPKLHSTWPLIWLASSYWNNGRTLPKNLFLLWYQG